jgi:hypothetical protein
MADDLRLGRIEHGRHRGFDRSANQTVCGRLPVHVVSIPASGTVTALESCHTGVSHRPLGPGF